MRPVTFDPRLGTMVLVAASALSLLTVHCGGPDGSGFDSNGNVTAPAPDDSSATSTNPNVTCKKDGDCVSGESCLQGVCQLPHCSEPPNPISPPLGKTYHLTHIQQLLATSAGASSIYGYDGTELTANGSWTAPGPVADMAGGAFLDTKEDAVAVAVSGSNQITVFSTAGAQPVTMAPPFSPIALAAGDMDGDGVDDVVGLGQNGQIAVCHPATKACDSTSMQSVTGVDVAVGPVSNGFNQAVFLVNNQGSYGLTVWSLSSAIAPVQLTLPGQFTHVAVGDIDGDGVAEIAALTSGQVQIYHVSNGALVLDGPVTVASDAQDIAMGTLDGSNAASLIVLRSQNAADVYAGKSASQMALAASTTLSGAGNVTRLALADVRGQSTIGTLAGAPELVQGRAIPLVVLFFPPYAAGHSAGASEVVLGMSKTKTTTTDSSLTLSAGFQIGLSGSIPQIVSAGISAKVSASLQTRASQTQTMRLSETFTLDPHPGNDNAGGVLLAGACYHAYTYNLIDPTGKFGANGKQMVVYAPVGGQKAIWSIARYNGLARTLGNLPVIPEAYKAGNVSTYPKTALTFGGKQIPGQDLVFTQFDSYRASDVATIQWSLDMSEGSTNSTATTASASVSVNASIGPVNAGADVGVSASAGYTISLGSDTALTGTVPALPLDPKSTTTDAYAKYGYSFTPIIYREHYRETTGTDASFFVMTYTVGQ